MEDGIEVTMSDYVKSMEDVKDIRKADRDEELTSLEMKEYRKITGKVSWLANSTRPDLCYTALEMSKNNKSATIADLRGVNRVLNKVRERERVRLNTRKLEKKMILWFLESEMHHSNKTTKLLVEYFSF